MTERVGIELTAQTDQFVNALDKGEKAVTTLKNSAKGLSSVDKPVQDFGKSLTTAAEGAAKFTAAMAAGATGAALFINSVGKSTDAVNGLFNRLAFLTGNLGKANEAMQYINQTAQKQGVSVTALGDAYAKLQTFVNDGMLSTTELRKILEGMNNAAKITGASTEQLGNVYYGLGQALSQGKVQAQEFNQVVEPIVGLQSKIAKALGMTSGELRKFVNDGKLTSDMLKTGLVKAVGEFDGASEKMGNTWASSSQSFVDSWTKLVAAIGNTDFFKDVFLGVRQLGKDISITADYVNVLTGNINALGRAGLEMVVQRDIAEINRLQDVIKEVQADIAKSPQPQFLDKLGYTDPRIAGLKKTQEAVDGLSHHLGDAIERAHQFDEALKHLDDKKGKGGIPTLSKEAESFAKKLQEIKDSIQADVDTFGMVPARQKLVEFETMLVRNKKAFGELGEKGKKAAADIRGELEKLASKQENEKLREVFQKVTEDWEKQQKELAEKMAQPFIHAAEEIQDTFAESITQMLEGGVSSFDDFAKRVKSLMFKMIGDIAAALVFKPLIAPVVASAATSLGGAAVGNAVSDSLGLGGLAGNAGSSIATNWISQQLGIPSISSMLGLGGSGTAALSASVAGEAAGAASLGLDAYSFGMLPSAAAEAGIGNAVIGGGSLAASGGGAASAGSALMAAAPYAVAAAAALYFGMKAFSGPRAHPASGFLGNLDANGGLQPGTVYDSKHMDTSFGQSLAQNIATFTSGLSSLGFSGFNKKLVMGGTDDGSGYIRVGDRTTNTVQDFNFDPNDANAMAKAIKDAGLSMADASTVINQDVLEAFKKLNTEGMTAADVLNTLAAAMQKSIDRTNFYTETAQKLVQATNPNTARALDAVNEYYINMKRAADMGADTQLLEQLHTTQMQQILATVNTSIQDTNKEIKQQISDNATLISQKKEEYSTAQKLSDTYAGIVKSLQGAMDKLKLGSLSPLTPEQKLAEASRQFYSIAARARLGDTEAAGQLPGAADAFLELKKKMDMGTAAYTETFEKVQAELQAAQETAMRQTDLQQAIANAAQEQVTLLQGIGDKLQASIDSSSGGATNDAFAREIATASTGGYGAVKNQEEVLIRALGFHDTAFGGGAGQNYIDQSGQRYRLQKLLAYYGINKFASGGIPVPNMPSLVGENGPELFIPHQSGRIANDNETSALLQRGGGRGRGDIAALANAVAELAKEQKNTNQRLVALASMSSRDNYGRR